MNKSTTHGVCALTHEQGKFVKSHIFPRALTKISKYGKKIIEAGIGHGKRNRPDTWYDNQLCTQAGESILERIDTAGIETLRELKLVWSGWAANEQTLVATDWDQMPIPLNGGPRLLEIPNEKAIRLFLLSILWRSSASSRREFDDVKLLRDEEEDLRIRILNENPGSTTKFPIILFQISSRGIPHNRTPLTEEDYFPGILDKKITRVRIYMDGFIAHIYLPRGAEFPEDVRNIFLGNHHKTIVFMNDFDKSRAKENINEMIIAVESEIHTPPHAKNTISAAVESF